MVSSRRTQNTKDEQDSEASEGENSVLSSPHEAQSPARKSTRRTRSNSSAEPQETLNTAKETSSSTEQKLRSTGKTGERKRRGSSVDVDDTEDKETVEAQHSATGTGDAHESDEEVKQSANTESTQQKLKTTTAEPSVVSLAVSKEKQQKNTVARTDDSNTGNELTKLIPGYTAPLKLDTSLLDSYRPAGGLADLHKRAQETDASTAGFVVSGSTEQQAARAMKSTSNGCMPTTYTSLYSSFKHGTKRAPDESAGKGWFGMVPTPMTDELKTDLALIRNRNYLDPKRFYKSSDSNKNKIVQLGTVIEGSAEFYSSRLSKKQRRTNLTEEIMADPAAADYTKTKYKKMQQANDEKAHKYQKRKKLSKRARRGY